MAIVRKRKSRSALEFSFLKSPHFSLSIFLIAALEWSVWFLPVAEANSVPPSWLLRDQDNRVQPKPLTVEQQIEESLKGDNNDVNGEAEVERLRRLGQEEEVKQLQSNTIAPSQQKIGPKSKSEALGKNNPSLLVDDEGSSKTDKPPADSELPTSPTSGAFHEKVNSFSSQARGGLVNKDSETKNINNNDFCVQLLIDKLGQLNSWLGIGTSMFFMLVFVSLSLKLAMMGLNCTIDDNISNCVAWRPSK
jgi:hypothetical protein